MNYIKERKRTFMENKINEINNLDDLNIKELAVLSAQLEDLDMQVNDILSDINEEEEE